MAHRYWQTPMHCLSMAGYVSPCSINPKDVLTDTSGRTTSVASADAIASIGLLAAAIRALGLRWNSRWRQGYVV